MTWTLTHNNKIVGEWSDDIIDRIASKLKETKKSYSISQNQDQNEAAKTVAEFLPEPIQDAFLS
jgi:hypothetical protein